MIPIGEKMRSVRVKLPVVTISISKMAVSYALT